ncbi:MAG: hypothetical protein ABFQ65_00255 [Nanoarchaeota archaeon]
MRKSNKKKCKSQNIFYYNFWFFIIGLLLIFSLIFVLNNSFVREEITNSFFIISSSLDSIKIMTGFIISEEIGEEEPIEKISEETIGELEEPPEEKLIIETPEEVIESQISDVGNQISEVEEVVEEQIENQTISESTNKIQQEESVITENITTENQTISENNNSETFNDSQKILNKSEEINQTIINQTVEQNSTQINITNISKNIILETNITEIISKVSITTTQYPAIVDKPVKWKKSVSLEEPKNIIVKLPAGSKNIIVKKIKENKDEKIINSKITGGVIGSGSEGFLFKFFKKIFRLTGGIIGIEETQELVKVNIDENTTEFEIEYETPAPQVFEENLENGKKITISGPDDVHYENVLSFTNLSETFDIKNTSNVKIYWVENKNYISIQKIEDTDGNGIYDYIEWVTPYLSEQNFIIEISSENINNGYGLEGHESYPLRGSEKYKRCLKVNSPVEFNLVKIKTKVGYVADGGDLYYGIYSHNSINDEPETELGNCDVSDPIKVKAWESCEISLSQSQDIYWICAYSLTGNNSTDYYNIYWNNQDTNKKRAFWTGSYWQKMDDASYTIKAEFKKKK